MITLIICYLIGALIFPIILILLDNIFPNSMELYDDGIIIAFFLCTVLWPIGLFFIGYLMFVYFCNKK